MITWGDADAPLVAIVLHGRMMEAADLAPFAKSLGVDAHFVFPDAPLVVQPRGRSWWPVDSEERARRVAAGPMDLHGMDPAGRTEARALLATLVESFAGRTVVLVGFSQGGMLAMDYVLHAPTRPAALALLSSSRIAFTEWRGLLPKLAGLPMLVAHGTADQELAFAAGENLRDAAIAGGADVTWLPFEGPHEIPLVVWRALRKLLRATPSPA
jgi:phospholipase/carboxylesterase